jgi:uncharacterized protein (TIGR00369 family)
MSSDSESVRTRTYDYSVPAPLPPELAALPGLEMMRALLAGGRQPPPIANTLAFTLTQVDKGVAVFEGEPAEWMYNPLGTVHGGWISALLDSALGCAVHTTLPAGATYTTASLEVKFVRAVLASTGKVRAEGRVIHAGNRVATAEARLVTAVGEKLLAHATTTCVILPRER